MRNTMKHYERNLMPADVRFSLFGICLRRIEAFDPVQHL
jgi:hypothetical protein